VDHFTDEPRVRVLALECRNHLLPEAARHSVGRVESEAVRAAREPMTHHLRDVRSNLRLVVIQRDQTPMTLEGGEVLRSRASLAEPVCVRGSRAVRDHFAQARKASPDVVEHAVEHQLEPLAVRCSHQLLEVTLIAEPRIDREVIERVVAVRLRREDRSERQRGAAKLDGVVEPRAEVLEPMHHRLLAL
jgi:hypothetical protein